MFLSTATFCAWRQSARSTPLGLNASFSLLQRGFYLMEEQIHPNRDRLAGIKDFYDKQYKKLLIIPFALLLIAIALISFKYATTGDFINRDITIKGGVTVTIPVKSNIDVLSLENSLKNDFPGNDISVRALSQFGTQVRSEE